LGAIEVAASILTVAAAASLAARKVKDVPELVDKIGFSSASPTSAASAAAQEQVGLLIVDITPTEDRLVVGINLDDAVGVDVGRGFTVVAGFAPSPPCAWGESPGSPSVGAAS
jgi:hypothetical protein